MWKIAIDRRGLLGVALGAALLSAAPISLHWSTTTGPSLSVDRAHARIGQPLSPGSIAGVNRRVNRRAARRGYYGGVAAAGAAAATSYSAGGYNNLYSYAPAANVAPAANTAATNASATASTSESSSNLPADSPELYASCLIRTYGSCP
jgi:peptidoglycan/LPS O-acetylase OafA/YrhL